MADADQSNLTTLTVDLLGAYLANNTVQHGDLPELIKSTHAALKVIDSPEPPAPVEPEYKPAVGVRKSLGSRTHIISMIDGKPYQTLKRHLSKHNLTPQEYRQRYSLPSDYPMVAPAYSESRRAIAERLGLGRKVTGAQATKPGSEEQPAAVEAAPAPAKAKKPAAAKASKAPATPAKAAVKPKARAKAAPVAAEAKPAPKARTKSAPAKAAAPADAPVAAKPAPRKRAAKAAAAAEPVN